MPRSEGRGHLLKKTSHNQHYYYLANYFNSGYDNRASCPGRRSTSGSDNGLLAQRCFCPICLYAGRGCSTLHNIILKNSLVSSTTAYLNPGFHYLKNLILIPGNQATSSAEGDIFPVKICIPALVWRRDYYFVEKKPRPKIVPLNSSQPC